VSPFLIEALKNPKASYWACLIVSEIGPEAEATVPALVELLDDPRPELRREAMLALAAIGPASAPAVPALAKALDDEINQVAATYALGRIGQAPPEAEAKIEQNAQSDEGVLGTISLWTLAKLHPEDTDRVGRAVKSLAEALKDPDPERRKAAANALVDLKADPQLVMPILQKTMDEASPEALAAIMDALAGLGEQAVPRLAAALKVQTARLRAAAILALMGPVAAPAVAALDEALADEDAATRTEVLMALAAIGPDAAAAVPTITSLLNAEEMNVRYAATYALGKIGSPAAAAKDELVKNLSAEDEFLPAASAWALSQIDPQSAETAAEAVPVLIQALEASEATTQIQAIEALGRFGPLAKKALPALEKLTEAPDEDLRTVAGNSIRLISAPAGAAPEPSAGKEITAGMTVVAAEDGAVLRGDDREIAKVPPGSRLEVLKIEAGWIGVKATVDGQTVTGWVQPAELKAP